MADTTELLDDAMIDPVTGEIIDQKDLAERLLAQAKEQGVSLVGPGGLLNQLTKNVLETALNAELTEHLGHQHGGTPAGSNMRNGTRTKTVLTEIGPVEIEVPRDRVGSFEPVIVPKRKRRLDGAVPAVAIVGYTNAGKSSLLNALTDAGVLVQDALFATLDPTTRRAIVDRRGGSAYRCRRRRSLPAGHRPAHPL